MKRITKALIFALLLVLAAALIAGVYWARSDSAPASPTKYHCPMHPTYVSDKPGDCPICGMRLVPMDGDGASSAESTTTPAAPATAPRKILSYRSPMNPSVTSPEPAKDEMGMDFVPVYADEAAGTAPVTGLASITVTDEARHLAGIQTMPAVREELRRTIRTVGNVVPDETRVHHVHTKIPGWIEKLHVNFTGQLVKKGEPTLTIYSPELLATQEEYLRTRTAAARFAGSSLPEVQRGGADLLSASRRRLELFDVPQSLISEIERSGKAQRTVTLASPVAGFVTGKDVFDGQQIEPGMEIYTITDLSHVWVEAAFYEIEARSVQVGATARVTLPYDPGVEIAGRISYVYPYLAPESRTLRARIDVENPGLALKPSMFTNVELSVDGGSGVVIPDSAVMDTGDRQVVFVDRGSGRFDPREVKVGVRDGGKVQILSGIAQGEQVVVRANFLLDSESRLRAAITTAGGAHKHGGASQ